jgi:hypothetical protein
MKSRNALLLLGVAIVLVVAFLVIEKPLSEKPSSLPSGEAEITRVPIFQNVSADACTRIDISQFDGRTTATLLKADDTWFVDRERKREADTRTLTQLFQAISNIKEGEVVSHNPANHPRFQVDPLTGTRATFRDTHDNVLADVVIGKMASDFGSTYVRKANSDDVLKVSGMLTHLVSRRGPDAWRDHMICDFSPETITAFVLKGANETIRLKKFADGTWQIVSPVVQTADAAAAGRFVGSFARLRAASFEDNEEEKPLKQFGLDPPQFSVQASLQDYSSTPTLLIGNEKEKPKGQFYAKREAKNQIYLIPSFQLDMLRKSVADFLPKKEEAVTTVAPRPEMPMVRPDRITTSPRTSLRAATTPTSATSSLKKSRQ